jgi:hypothetical protein
MSELLATRAKPSSSRKSHLENRSEQSAFRWVIATPRAFGSCNRKEMRGAETDSSASARAKQKKTLPAGAEMAICHLKKRFLHRMKIGMETAAPPSQTPPPAAHFTTEISP